MVKEYWVTDSRFKWMSLLLVFIFLVAMVVIVWQGENISKNPCSICAEKQGTDVSCSTIDNSGRSKTFSPDGTEIYREITNVNLTNISLIGD